MARLLLFIIIFAAAVASLCHAGEHYYSGGPYYFKGIKNDTAYEPVDEINYEEANNLYTYYEAYFDAKGKIISLSKYTKGKLEWSDRF